MFVISMCISHGNVFDGWCLRGGSRKLTGELVKGCGSTTCTCSCGRILYQLSGPSCPLLINQGTQVTKLQYSYKWKKISRMERRRGNGPCVPVSSHNTPFLAAMSQCMYLVSISDGYTFSSMCLINQDEKSMSIIISTMEWLSMPLLFLLLNSSLFVWLSGTSSGTTGQQCTANLKIVLYVV